MAAAVVPSPHGRAVIHPPDAPADVLVEKADHAPDAPGDAGVADADAETLPRWSDAEDLDGEEVGIPATQMETQVETQMDLGEPVEQKGIKRLGHFNAEALELAASHGPGIPASSSNGDAVEGQALVASEDVLSPASEMKLKKQKQIDIHRANSSAWHQKWISKGVLRNPVVENNELISEPASEPASRPASEPASELANPSDVPRSFESLQAAQNWFIKDWISKSPMPKSNARRTLAIKAWMESPLRANMLAGRVGIQMR